MRRDGKQRRCWKELLRGYEVIDRPPVREKTTMICCGIGVTRSAAKPADFFLRQVLQDAAQSAAVLANSILTAKRALVKGQSP